MVRCPAGRVQRIQSGAVHRLDATVPVEVAPLVEEINALLAQRDEEAQRASHRAADLAHGLKTPLSAILADVERLQGAAGGPETARDIADGVNEMRRVVERELARARMRSVSRSACTAVANAIHPVAAAVARTLSRSPEGERAAIDIAVGDDVTAFVDLDDLHDILGNLMENAQRAARSVVCVAAIAEGRHVVVSVDDDGTMGDPQAMTRLAERGARLDQRCGAGLGLAIVGDILAAYEAELQFSRSRLGGLSVRFLLPARRKV